MESHRAPRVSQRRDAAEQVNWQHPGPLAHAGDAAGASTAGLHCREDAASEQPFLCASEVAA